MATGFSKAKLLGNIAYAGFCAVAAGAYLSVHGPLLEHYKEQIAFYEKGRQKKLPLGLSKLCQDVLHDMNLDEAKKKRVRFFLVTGDSPVHVGTLNFDWSWGSMVGLPYNFSYRSFDDVETRHITAFNGQSIKWDSSTGKRLKDSLWFSDKAKKFAIAKEIYFTDTSMIFMRAGAITVSLLLVKAIVELGLQKYNLRGMPTKSKIGLYMATAMLTITNYFLLTDGANLYHDRKSDERAALINDDYFEGGIEYYNKLMQRNKAFRRLLGDDGPGYYSSEGDTRTIRGNYLPLTEHFRTVNSIKNSGSVDQ